MTKIVVNSTADAGPGSLREAIGNAQNTDIIVFDPSLNGQTILLSSTLNINRGITIDGTGSTVTISGGNAVTVFRVANPSAVFATLKNLTIANGKGTGTPGTDGTAGNSFPGEPGYVPDTPPTDGTDAAGGVYVASGKLRLIGDTFVGNSATGGKGGDAAPNNYGNGYDGGNGGTAAGAVLVEPGATVEASGLSFVGNTANGGVGGQNSDAFGTDHSGQGYSDSNNQVVDDAVCFVSGTLIRTLRGDVAVEDLQAGDEAITASGEIRPIVWVGQRVIACSAHPRASEIWPVRIRAGAFGADLPERDLLLSPGHPVLVGGDSNGEAGYLVPIMCLINGTTIERVPVDEVTYWHIELDAHDILLAEGLPAESYLDWGDRAFFSEAEEHALMNPDFVVPGLAGRCRRVAIEGPVVEAERRRLDVVFATQLAIAAGWPDAADALTI